MEAIIRMQKRPLLFREYKKQIPSSVQEVNDDLLIEIFLRLPVISLVRFKLVSKHWLSLITDTVFTELRSQSNIDPPSGLFLKEDGYNLVLPDLGVKSLLRNNFVCESIIKHSCNGLLLCCILPNKLYVYNPTTNMCKMLPEHHSVKYDPLSKTGGTRLAFDPTKSPHYKVVHAGLTKDKVIQITVYSSETCNWSDHDDQFPSCSFDCFEDGIYWNGSINWLNKLDGAQLLYFKLEITHHPVLTTMENLGIIDGIFWADCNLFESRGDLLFLGMDYIKPPRWAKIYEMRNGWWSIRYVVDFEDNSIFPRSWSRHWDEKIVCWWIVIEEKEEDSYMIIRFDREVVKYNMASKSIRMLDHLKPEFSPSTQFIASFAHM